MKKKEWYWRFILAAALMFAVCLAVGCGSVSYFEAKENSAAAESGDETGKEPGGKSGQESGESAEICYVHVSGAVAHPGVYQLPVGSRVYQAIEMAGGLTENASDRELNLAEGISDGQKLYVYTAEESLALSVSGRTSPGDGAENGSEDVRVNINTAGEEELMTLPGIGEAKARAIIDYREENGGFSAPEDIKNISGIKDGVYSKIRDSICVN